MKSEVEVGSLLPPGLFHSRSGGISGKKLCTVIRSTNDQLCKHQKHLLLWCPILLQRLPRVWYRLKGTCVEDVY